MLRVNSGSTAACAVTISGSPQIQVATILALVAAMEWRAAVTNLSCRNVNCHPLTYAAASGEHHDPHVFLCCAPIDPSATKH
eukprot:scaffold190934_cov35-Tisochrysis_lutea.AAC.1